VLEASGRPQSHETTLNIIALSRALGFASVNLDLIYGLPKQTEETFAQTIAEVVRIRPSRIALYSFAFVPWVKKNQEKIDTSLLPTRDTKFALFAIAVRELRKAGYRQIGMDHFALPEDALSLALDSGNLYRNFMGYTVHRAADMVGVGVSSIGFIAGAFSQNEKATVPYYRAIDKGEFPVERGYLLSADDAIRQAVITELMCNSTVRFSDIEQRFSISFAGYFAAELQELRELANGSEHPFTREEKDTLEVTAIGQLFVRNVSMTFDAYLKRKSTTQPVFSRTV
jgi:oxygen-independent coproporphyrinogen-3 oxidase